MKSPSVLIRRWLRLAWLAFLLPIARVDAQLFVQVSSPGPTPQEAAADAEPGSGDAADEDEFVDEYASAAGPTVSDPFERVNRTVFKFNNTVYKHVLRPVTRGYEYAVPRVARRGIRSFFDNVYFPVRFISSTLQGKFDRAAAETGKFALNSTVGLAGFIRVSDRYPALRVPKEDIGQAFGVWGIGQGPFLVLPVLGPSTFRDGVGRIGDYYANPIHWEFVDDFDAWVETTLQVGDTLSSLPDLLATHDSLYRSAVDPYIAFRNAYLQFREGEVRK